MVKLKLGIGADAANIKATEGRANYTGETPPAGLYRAKVTSFSIGKTKDKSKDMFTAVVSFEAPKGDDRSKFDGYPIFHRLVVPDDKAYEYFDLQVGQINRFLDAIGGANSKAVRTALWGDNAVIDEKGRVLKVGPVNLKAKGGVFVMVDTKQRSFERAVLEKGKPKKDDKGKVVKETVVNLEINDIYPINLSVAKDSEPEPETEIEEEYEEAEAEDEDPWGAVPEDGTFGGDPEDEEVEEEVEEEPEEEEPEEEVEEDPEPEPQPAKRRARPVPVPEPEEDDGDDMIAEEVAEEPEPEEEPEEAPAPKRRTRRKAF